MSRAVAMSSRDQLPAPVPKVDMFCPSRYRVQGVLYRWNCVGQGIFAYPTRPLVDVEESCLQFILGYNTEQLFTQLHAVQRCSLPTDFRPWSVYLLSRAVFHGLNTCPYFVQAPLRVRENTRTVRALSIGSVFHEKARRRAAFSEYTSSRKTGLSDSNAHRGGTPGS